MVDGSTVFTAVGEVTVCSLQSTILKWSPASRDEQYPLLCSLTSPIGTGNAWGTPICQAFMEIPSASSEGPVVPARCPTEALEKRP